MRSTNEHSGSTRVFLIAALTILLFNGISVMAQSGMDFREFRSKLDLYYDSAMVEDVVKDLPDMGTFRVWGWDVGDFSGDGNYDVAFSIRMNDDRRRQVRVFLYVDIDGYLTNVRNDLYTFVETPLEVGMVIKNNGCYVTEKQRQYEWLVRGYRFTHGCIELLDEFVTSRIDRFSREYYCNYESLRHELRFYQQGASEPVFDVHYLSIPSFARGESLSMEHTLDADVQSVDFVTKGSFYWTGPNDCSYQVRSVYDDKYLYLRISVRDSDVVIAHCDTCPADNIDIWFDTQLDSAEQQRVFTKTAKRLQFRNTSDSNMFCLHVSLGDFRDKDPSVQVRTTNVSTTNLKQQIALTQLNQKVALRDHGYVLRLRVPFSLFGIDELSMHDGKNIEMGCTVVVHDIDNEYRPEEETTLATSDIEEMNPSTFGTVVFIPENGTLGDVRNIFAEHLVGVLNALGF